METAERQTSEELPERWSARAKTEIVLTVTPRFANEPPSDQYPRNLPLMVWTSQRPWPLVFHAFR